MQGLRRLAQIGIEKRIRLREYKSGDGGS